MDAFRLRHIFLALIQLSYKHTNNYGNPCSYLLENMVLYNDSFIKRMVNAPDTYADSHEMRLNGAGLKLIWMHFNNRFWCDVCGDQVDLYPGFKEEATEIFRKYNAFSINSQQ